MTTSIRTTQQLDFDRCYRAVQSRDARFDGQFFVAVHTTGIYCRPSCPAQTPRPRNVHFELTAAAAQQQGFRACRRCTPDAVPGSPRWNAQADLSSRAMRLIADGVVEREGVDGLAAGLGYTQRHLNRVLTAELGAGPLALARAHRAGTARVLIQCTTMPMSDVAFAAGFRSVRQFNDTIREVFGLTPTRLRALRSRSVTTSSTVGEVSLRLPYRRPLDTRWLCWFLSAHAVAGVERVDLDNASLPGDGWMYRRTLRLPNGPALVTIRPAATHVICRVAHLDMRDLSVAVNRIRRLLDLDADTASADAALRRDGSLTALVDAAPGLRVPGSVDPAETLIQTMIGQQISVKAARHHLRRLVADLGRPAPWDSADPGDAGWLLFPDTATIAEQGHRVLSGPRRRIDAIVAVAEALAERRVEPHAGCAASDLRAALLSLPGVGEWTADYVTMRVTGDPDIMLDRDLVVRRAATDLGIDLGTAAAAWSPWRSYASMHLWRHRLAHTEPMLSEPVLSEPMLSEPVLSEPVLSEPVLSEPVLSEPLLSEPRPPGPRPPEPRPPEPIAAPTATRRRSTMTTTDIPSPTPADTAVGQAGPTARWTSVATPDGTFTILAADDDRVLASGWTDDPDYLTALIHRAIRPESVQRTNELGAICDSVESYYAGEFAAVGDIEVHQRSGPFLERAWSVLRTVVPGEPVTYSRFAELAGDPAAVRAAAAACSRNAAALFVPCHRVLRTDGSLGGFRYGLTIKQSLLTRESDRPD